MKKFLLTMFAALATLAMSAGEVTFDATVDIDTENSAAGAWSITKDGVTLASTGGVGYNGTHYRFYQGNTVTISSDYTITKIVFTCDATGTTKYGPGCLTASDGTYTYEESGYTGTWEGSATSVDFSCSLQVRATSVVVTFEDGGTTKLSAGLAWSETSIKIEKGTEFTAPTLTKETTADVTFESDNEAVATVTSDGVIAITGELGTAVITASAEANDEYYAGKATCTVSVYSYKTYKKATAVTAGKEYLIVAQANDTTYYAYPGSASSSYTYLYTYYITEAVDEISISTLYDDGFIIDTQDDGYSLVDVSTGRYYYQNGTYTSFQIASEAPEAVWYFTAQEDGTFKMDCNNYYVQYSPNYSSFGIYSAAQDGGLLPYLYELVEEEEDEGDTWSLVGGFNSWNATDTTYDFTYQGNGVYTLELASFGAGFKIIKDHAWDTQYCSNGDFVNVGETYTLGTGGDITLTNYVELTNAVFTLTITDDAATLLVTAESATVPDFSYYFCGASNSWNTSANPFSATDTEGVYTLDLESLSGEFGILGNATWDYKWCTNGSDFTLGEAYTLVQGAGNISTDSSYSNVTLTLTIADGVYTLLMTETGAEDTDGIAAVSAETIDVNAPVYNIAGQRVSPDAKGVLIQGGKKFVNK